MFHHLQTLLTRRANSRLRRPRVMRRPQSIRPGVETLEDRWVPTTHIWIGTPGGLWSNPSNWAGGVPTSNEPGGTIVQFNGGSVSVDNLAGLVINELHFAAGGNLVAGTGGVTLGINGYVVPHNLVNDAGNNTVDASLPLNLSGTFWCDAMVTAGQLTLASAVSGDQGLELVSGTLELAGSGRTPSPDPRESGGAPCR